MWYIIIFSIIIIVIIAVSIVATLVYIDYKKAIDLEEIYEQYNKDYNEKKEKLIVKQYYKDLKLEQNLEEEEYKIVGIREPIGRWTKMITEQQSGSYITAIRMFMQDKLSSGGKVGKLGRWQLTIKAQSLSSSQGKQRGRGK